MHTSTHRYPWERLGESNVVRCACERECLRLLRGEKRIEATRVRVVSRGTRTPAEPEGANPLLRGNMIKSNGLWSSNTRAKEEEWLRTETLNVYELNVLRYLSFILVCANLSTRVCSQEIESICAGMVAHGAPAPTPALRKGYHPWGDSKHEITGTKTRFQRLHRNVISPFVFQCSSPDRMSEHISAKWMAKQHT